MDIKIDRTDEMRLRGELEGRTDVEAARKLASPLHQISPKTKPILIIHSDDDKSVPIQQAVDMAQALEKAKLRSRFVHYKDRGHMGITPEVIKEALSFIKEESASRGK